MSPSSEERKKLESKFRREKKTLSELVESLGYAQYCVGDELGASVNTPMCLYRYM